MNMKTRFTICEKVVGRKTAEKERFLQPYTLYDNCDICPLWVYIDLVCDDNLQSLVITGTPPESALREAKERLIFDYNNRFINMSTSVNLNAMQSIYSMRTELQMMVLCMNLITRGEAEAAKPYLRKFGIYTNSQDKIVSSLESKIKALHIHLNRETEKFNKEVKTEKTTRQDFEKQLVLMSKYFGFPLQKKILTLAEYAGYLNEYNNYLDNLKNTKYGDK